MAGNILPSDLANIAQAVEIAFPNTVTGGASTATVEAVWKHGADPINSTYYAAVNDGTGSGTPYWPCTLVNTGAVYGTSGPSMSVTKGTAVADSYLAITALVTAEGSVAP